MSLGFLQLFGTLSPAGAITANSGGSVVSFSSFLSHMAGKDGLPFIVIILLVLGVVFVNGWTDAPNAIATAVSTRSINPRRAILMAAVFDFLGVFVMMLVNGKVAETISKMVDFETVSISGTDNPVLIALCAAMAAIVIWAVAAWYFGIPTSESHALIAGLTGSALAMGGWEGVNMQQWARVLYGIALSTVLGFGLGWGIYKIIRASLRRVQDSRAMRIGKINKHGADRFFTYGQNASAAFMAFMHGAQDGQKFIGVFILAMFVAKKQPLPDQAVNVIAEGGIWLIALVSATISIGASIGGYRIIKTVGMDMVKLKKPQGLAADLSASICLLLSTLTGLPVSTTHTKTTSMMGVAVAEKPKSLNLNVVKEMFAAWFLTFPGCGLIAYGMTLLFQKIF